MNCGYKPMERTVQPLTPMAKVQISNERCQQKSPNGSEKEYDQRILKATQYKLLRIFSQKVTVYLQIPLLQPRHFSYIHILKLF